MFPILPEKINIKHAGDTKSYDIIDKGKVSSINKPELAEISFESFFPAQRYPFVTADPLFEPHTYVNYLNKWMQSGYPVRFIYVGNNAENDATKINIAMTIESFERWEEGGSPGDIFYSLKLKEYVFYSAKRVTAVKKADGTTILKKEPAKRPDERVKPTTYTLKPGDTLISVARTQLGSSDRWKEIQKLNNIKDWEIKKLQVGKVLQLPK